MLTTLIIVPCFNEELRLRSIEFLRFAIQHRDVGFVFVDDGSRDATLDKLTEIQSHNPDQFHVVSLPSNEGKAEAVRQGLLFALKKSPREVGFWDADLATPLTSIPVMRDVLVRRPDTTMVFGTRISLLGRQIQRNAMRRLLGRLFSIAVSVSLGINVRDTQCGAKMFRVTPAFHSILAQRFSSRWIFDVEILARLMSIMKPSKKRETSVYELPLDEWKEVGGSQLKSQDFIRASAELLLIAWRYRRGHYPSLDDKSESDIVEVTPIPSRETLDNSGKKAA